MNTFFQNMRALIGWLIILFSFAFLFTLIWIPIPDKNKDILQIASGIMLGIAGSVATYYFGSSKDKSDSDKASFIQKTPEIKP